MAWPAPGAALGSSILEPVLAVRPHDQKNRQSIKDKHEGKVQFRARTRVGKFLPRENSPKRRDHRSRLADGVRDCHPRKVRSDQIENRSSPPHESTEQTEQMSRRGPSKKSAETHRIAHERMFHEVDIPDKTGEQRS